MSDEGLQQVLDGRFKQEWQTGGFDRLIPAFIFCAWNDLTMPPWLREAVLDELQFSYKARKRGGPSARTGAIQDRSNRVHSTRHQLMLLALAQQAQAIKYGTRSTATNKNEAAHEVRRILNSTKHPARGSRDSILESYNLLETRAK